MAHFALVNANNIVTQVTVVNNDDINDLDFPESEPVGSDFLISLFGELEEGERWLQSSYNGNFRVRHATINDTYDPEADCFIRPAPWASWNFDSELKDWVPPVEMPVDGQLYTWDEDTTSWIVNDTRFGLE